MSSSVAIAGCAMTDQRFRSSTNETAPRQPACGGPLLGTWKLQSFKTEYPDTRETKEPLGAHPTGYLSYGADCRMYAILAGEGRKLPAAAFPTDAEKIALFDGMGAYAGTYTVEGNTVTHHVDVSWNEAWTGTDQVRQFKIEGDTLQIRAHGLESGRDSLSTLLWTRVKR